MRSGTLTSVSAAYWKILIEQGGTWRRRLTLRDASSGAPVDLTGYTARMQARATVEAADTLLSIGTATGEMVIDGPAGRIDLLISAVTSAAWTWRYGVYQLELVAPNGDVTRLLSGEIELDREVVR